MLTDGIPKHTCCVEFIFYKRRYYKETEKLNRLKFFIDFEVTMKRFVPCRTVWHNIASVSEHWS